MASLFLPLLLSCAAGAQDFPAPAEILRTAARASAPAVEDASAVARARRYRADPGLLTGFSPEEQEKTPPPYAARYTDGSRSLSFIAARHGDDPETFALIEREIRLLEPQLTIIEGVSTADGENPRLWIDRMAREGLDRKMEPFFAARRTLETGASFVGGEPAPGDLKAMMTRAGCPEEDLQGFYILRSLLGRRAEGIAEDAAFAAARAEYAREYDAAVLFSAKSFKDWYARRNGKPFSYAGMTQDEVWPAVGETTLGTKRIESVMGRARDQHLLALIADALERRERILVVYGAGHHVGLRPALEALIGKPPSYAR